MSISSYVVYFNLRWHKTWFIYIIFELFCFCSAGAGEEGGSVFIQNGLDWSFLCSFPVNKYGYPSIVLLLPTNLLVVGNSNGKITIWRLLNVRPGASKHQVILLHTVFCLQIIMFGMILYIFSVLLDQVITCVPWSHKYCLEC